MKFLRLRKSAEEINFKKDLIEAGKSKGKKDKVSEEQLEMGKEVEKEHTTNPEIAEKITRDHLEEIPDYYTHLKKMEDAVRKESAIQQPNKPKPTTTLPDNMEWSWDPNAADWVAVMKNNTNVTPPLYNPQNQNLVNQNTTSYMSNIKSSNNYIDEATPEYESRVREAYKQLAGMIEETDILADYAKRSGDLKLFDAYIQLGREIAEEWEVKPEAVFGEMVLSSPELPQRLADIDKENFNKENNEWLKKHSSLEDLNTSVKTLKIQASCLAEFLDGPRYSKEVKIEAGLIKDGLLKYAGFDFNRGAKYAITTAGLEVLRRASEAEHNEAQNEREKLAYLFGFNTDKETILDTTGHYIKGAKKFTICEADGTELGEVEALDEIDAKVKFGIEHPEYADSQSISAKEIDAKYEQTTEQHLDYPNPSETPHTDVIIENHDGWVNTAKKREYTPEEKRMLPLFKLINEYVAKKEITLSEDPQKDGNIVATGQAEVINDLEHQIKDLGFYCEPIAEITDEDYIGYDIYSLRIFTK